jgi:hypothetical protein
MLYVICDGKITAFAGAALAVSRYICAGIKGCCRVSEGLFCHFEVANSGIDIGPLTAEMYLAVEGVFA